MLDHNLFEKKKTIFVSKMIKRMRVGVPLVPAFIKNILLTKKKECTTKLLDFN
jgi:hypothetical protein